MNKNKKFGGIINNWTFNTLSVTVETVGNAHPEWDIKTDKCLVLSGYVVDDPLGRWQIGWHMKSSMVLDYDEASGTVETVNTIYTVEGKMLENADMGDVILKVFY